MLSLTETVKTVEWPANSSSAPIILVPAVTGLGCLILGCLCDYSHTLSKWGAFSAVLLAFGIPLYIAVSMRTRQTWKSPVNSKSPVHSSAKLKSITEVMGFMSLTRTLWRRQLAQNTAIKWKEKHITDLTALFDWQLVSGKCKAIDTKQIPSKPLGLLQIWIEQQNKQRTTIICRSNNCHHVSCVWSTTFLTPQHLFTASGAYSWCVSASGTPIVWCNIYQALCSPCLALLKDRGRDVLMCTGRKAGVSH